MPSSVLENQSPAAQRHTKTPVSNRIASLGVTDSVSATVAEILLVFKNTERSFLLTISKETQD